MAKNQLIKEIAKKRLKLFENFVNILVSKYGYRHNFFLTDFYSIGIALEEIYFKESEIIDTWQKYLQNKNNKNHHIQLYIGCPYCTSRCSCCIYFKEIGVAKLVEEYKNNLIAFINSFSNVLKNINFDNIYFGGGTPSIFTEKQTEEICCAIEKKIRFDPKGERTVECNPATTTFKKLKSFKKAGFNRVSFGVQSLNPKVLKEINRGYQTFPMVKDSILGAKKAGIEYINVDLMLGLYNDTPKSFINTFKKIIALKPYTVRVYSSQPIKSYLDKYFKGKLSNFEKHYEKQKQVLTKLRLIASEMNFSYEKEGLEFNRRSTSATDFKNKDIPPLNAVYHTYIEDKEASLFCLGHAGNSYIYNQIRYRSTPLHKDPSKNTFIGIKTDRKNEMAYFLLNNLSNDKAVSLKAFKKVFKANLRDEFEYEIKLLESLNKIEFNGDKMIFLPVQAKERFTYSMFFIPYPQLLKNLKNLLDGKGKTLPIKKDNGKD